MLAAVAIFLACELYGSVSPDDPAFDETRKMLIEE